MTNNRRATKPYSAILEHRAALSQDSLFWAQYYRQLRDKVTKSDRNYAGLDLFYRDSVLDAIAWASA
jgi:hypothetical protein